jgi:hypothetical protein
MVDKRPPFAIRSTDVHSVTTALDAAERSWKRGETAAVIRWVQRAAEAASEAEDDARALELTKCARELGKLQAASTKRVVPDSAPSLTPSSVHLLTKLAQPRTLPAGATRVVDRADIEALASESSPDGEVTRGRLPSMFEEDTNEVAIFQLRDAIRKRKDVAPETPLAPRTLLGPHGAKPSATDEWSIETMSSSDVVPLSDDAITDEPTPSEGTVFSSQSVRVLLWRDEAGALYITTSRAAAPGRAIEAMLTALEPADDLVALLREPKP